MSVLTAVPGARWGARAPRVRAYLAYSRLGMRQEIDARAALLGRAGFLVVILFCFSRIWSLVFAAGALSTHSQAELLWYIAITELVVLGFPYIHTEMENDFKTGEMLVRLPQPVSYVGARFAEALGGTAVRIMVLAPVGLLAPVFLVDGYPLPPASLAIAFAVAAVALLFALLADAAIGICTVWIHDTSPVFWFWQKLAFVLGGLLLPLDVYPPWLRSIAEWTPFGAMLSGPGQLVFGGGVGEFALTLARLGGWTAIGCVLLLWLWRRGLRTLDAHGG
jgi:ABC-2 type transport system permease protein